MMSGKPQLLPANSVTAKKRSGFPDALSLCLFPLCQTAERLCVAARHVNLHTIADNSTDASMSTTAMPPCGRCWFVSAEALSLPLPTLVDK